MRKHFKTFIVTAFACSLLLGAGISAKAESKVAINDTNFSAEVKRKAEEADTNKDGYLSEGEASRVRTLRFDSVENIDSFKGIEYFTELEDFVNFETETKVVHKTVYYTDKANEPLCHICPSSTEPADFQTGLRRREQKKKL